ncbi:uncharacterized protein LOC127243530 [Andrographis paniculata]|uniref:uncharacterized protein LOC127243530 n=1 Tax=Andrographis paniculata TaxID=175694 RepID=UPI0021E74244|nr:uncharacterized protein LOC127243530 [Andrographis paniculata]
MPLSGFAISQPCSCFSNNLAEFRYEASGHSQFVVGNDRGLGSAFYWKTLCITKKVGKKIDFGRVEVWRGGLMVKAVATFEIAKKEGVKGYRNFLRMDMDSGSSNGPAFEMESSSKDSKEVNEREKLRRKRISKANKGNTPWNKGRKHSPETLQRIKERTRLAMQDPKVKMKLINLGHAQSEETKVKIGMGVRLGWERRRERLRVQETCHYEWLNLVAEAARKGFLGEEELQWDSYMIISKELEQEWLQSVEERKHMPKPKGNKRAPKSAEQKRRISEAIAAKWADPDYRDRVCTGLSKFHGTDVVARKPRTPTTRSRPTQRSRREKDNASNLEKRCTIQVQRPRLKSPRGPSYKDPLANSKLEMIKDIRAQRAAAVTGRSEAVFKAKLLISEAEKAAAALETAAKSNPQIQASLAESRKLIAEAIQYIESIESEDPVSFDNQTNLSEPRNEEQTNQINQATNGVIHSKLNGVHSAFSGDIFVPNKFVLPELLNGNVPELVNGNVPNSHHRSDQQASLLSLEFNHNVNRVDLGNEHLDEASMGRLEFQPENGDAPTKDSRTIKKWVRGKLVEVSEETNL